MTVRSLLGRVKRKVGRAFLPSSAIREMVGGYKIELAPRADPYQRAMFETGTYEPATLALFDAVLRPGDTAVDVGANLGLMTIHAATRVGPSGRVIAVEAHPSYFKRLVRNIELNPIGNVRAVNNAAGSLEEDRVIFDVPSVNIGRSSLVDPGSNATAGGTTRVRRLDDILTDENVDEVRLLKIDVEGFEAEVIRGAPKLLKMLPLICMEIVYDQPQEGGADPLSAHDLIMDTGLYDAFEFESSKFKVSRLRPLRARDRLVGFHDNVLYISQQLRKTLPGELFV